MGEVYVKNEKDQKIFSTIMLWAVKHKVHVSRYEWRDLARMLDPLFDKYRNETIVESTNTARKLFNEHDMKRLLADNFEMRDEIISLNIRLKKKQN